LVATVSSDLAVELDIFLDDHPRAVAAHPGHGMIPGGADFVAGASGALALARARHHRLDHARQPDLRGRGDRLIAAFGETVAGGDEAELACGEIADSVAVHGQLHRFG